MEAIDLYVEFLRGWLLAGVVADSVCLLDAEFFSALKFQWDILHPYDPECKGEHSLADYSKWTPPREARVECITPYYHMSIDKHWVTSHSGEHCCIKLYDSLSHQLFDQELRPLRLLLPKLLYAAQYCTESDQSDTYKELPLKRMPSDVLFMHRWMRSVVACMRARMPNG